MAGLLPYQLFSRFLLSLNNSRDIFKADRFCQGCHNILPSCKCYMYRQKTTSEQQI